MSRITGCGKASLGQRDTTQPPRPAQLVFRPVLHIGRVKVVAVGLLELHPRFEGEAKPLGKQRLGMSCGAYAGLNKEKQTFRDLTTIWRSKVLLLIAGVLGHTTKKNTTLHSPPCQNLKQIVGSVINKNIFGSLLFVYPPLPPRRLSECGHSLCRIERVFCPIQASLKFCTLELN